MSTKVNVIRQDEVARIVFSNDEPGKPPTLSMKILTDLEHCINEINSHIDEYRVVVVESDSDKYFIVGANIESLKNININTIENWVNKFQSVFNKFESIQIPTIAKVQGYALGGGLELILRSDFIIGKKKSYYGQPEASLGFVPGAGGSYKLTQRVGEAKSKELFFRGNIIDGNEAYRIGLINHVCEDNQIESYLNEIIVDIKKNDSFAIKLIKKMISNINNQNCHQNYHQEFLASIDCVNLGENIKRIEKFLKRKNKR